MTAVDADHACRRCHRYVDRVAYDMSLVKYGVALCDRCYVAAARGTTLICSQCGENTPADDPVIEQGIRHYHRILCPGCYVKPDHMAGVVVNKNSSLLGTDETQDKLRKVRSAAIQAEAAPERPPAYLTLSDALSALAEALEQGRLTDEDYQDKVAEAYAAALGTGR